MFLPVLRPTVRCTRTGSPASVEHKQSHLETGYDSASRGRDGLTEESCPHAHRSFSKKWALQTPDLEVSFKVHRKPLRMLLDLN